MRLLNVSNWCSLALSDAASPGPIDTIVSTAKLDTPRASPPASQGAEMSTQPSAATEASEVHDIVAEIVESVSAAAEGKVSMRVLNPLSSVQGTQQNAQPVLAESESLPSTFPLLHTFFNILACLILGLSHLCDLCCTSFTFDSSKKNQCCKKRADNLPPPRCMLSLPLVLLCTLEA
jgi:hypothetical protein